MFIKQHRADYRCYFDLEGERGEQEDWILAKKTNLMAKEMNLVLGNFQYFQGILIVCYSFVLKMSSINTDKAKGKHYCLLGFWRGRSIQTNCRIKITDKIKNNLTAQNCWCPVHSGPELESLETTVLILCKDRQKSVRREGPPSPRPLRQACISLQPQPGSSFRISEEP